VEAAAVASPPLTTIRQPVREIGMRAAKLLIQQIESGTRTPERVIFPGELVQRDSTTAFAPEAADTSKRPAAVRRIRRRRTH